MLYIFMSSRDMSRWKLRITVLTSAETDACVGGGGFSSFAQSSASDAFGGAAAGGDAFGAAAQQGSNALKFGAAAQQGSGFGAGQQAGGFGRGFGAGSSPAPEPSPQASSGSMLSNRR